MLPSGEERAFCWTAPACARGAANPPLGSPTLWIAPPDSLAPKGISTRPRVGLCVRAPLLWPGMSTQWAFRGLSRDSPQSRRSQLQRHHSSARSASLRQGSLRGRGRSNLQGELGRRWEERGRHPGWVGTRLQRAVGALGLLGASDPRLADVHKGRVPHGGWGRLLGRQQAALSLRFLSRLGSEGRAQSVWWERVVQAPGEAARRGDATWPGTHRVPSAAPWRRPHGAARRR